MQHGRYPELRFLFAIPNGGLRHAVVAAKLRREGVRPGVPDVCLPVARGGYHGLWIEMKAGTNKPTDKQEDWIRDLAAQGHVVAVCWSAEVAIKIITLYLEGKCSRDSMALVGATEPSSSSPAGPRYRINRQISLSSDEPPTPAASS